jgi:hypothetical protein
MKAHVRPAGICGEKPGEFYLMLSAITVWCLVILMAGGPGTRPEADFGSAARPLPAATLAPASSELTNENATFVERYVDLIQRTEGS